MKFDRLALIDVIDEIEADRKAKHDAKHQPRLDAWNKAVEKYKATGAPKLTEQLRSLADKARRGQILTERDISKVLGFGSGVRTFAGFTPPNEPDSRRYGVIDEPPKPIEYHPDRELAALRKLLTQATGDTYVTTSILRDLGFSPSLFIKAAS